MMRINAFQSSEPNLSQQSSKGSSDAPASYLRVLAPKDKAHPHLHPHDKWDSASTNTACFDGGQLPSLPYMLMMCTHVFQCTWDKLVLGRRAAGTGMC